MKIMDLRQRSTGLRAAKYLILVLWLIWMTSRAPREAGQGLCFLLAGCWMVGSHSLTRIPLWLWTGSLLWLATSVLCFLPSDYGGSPSFINTLSGLGLGLGGQITLQPEVSIHALSGLVAAGLVFLRILAVRCSDDRVPAAGGWFVVAVLTYLVPSWIRWELDGGQGAHFGFFANRNHNATLIVMGLLVAVGQLLHWRREKFWGLVGFHSAAICLFACALVFLNVSRAGIVLAILGVLGIALVAGSRSFEVNSWRVIGLLVLAGAVILLIPDSAVKERLGLKLGDPLGEVMIGEYSNPEGRWDGRLEIYIDSWRMLMDQPWTGWGGGVFPTCSLSIETWPRTCRVE
jgi:hypothetical protein